MKEEEGKVTVRMPDGWKLHTFPNHLCVLLSSLSNPFVVFGTRHNLVSVDSVVCNGLR